MSDRCDPEIYENGTTIAIVADRGADAIEELVTKLSSETGVRVDWFYMAGRGVVLAIGDLQAARNAFRPYTNGWLVVVEEDGGWTHEPVSQDTPAE